MKIIFILSVILLIKQSIGRAVDTSTSLTPADEAFFNATISKLAILAEEPIKLSKKLLEDTYADNLNHQNYLVSEFIADVMTEFEKLDLDEESGKVGAVVGYIMLFDFINRVDIVDENEKELFQAVKVEFDKHNIKGVANVIQRKFDEFLEWMIHELETKSDKLTPQEQLKVKSFKELYQQIKEETDFKQNDSILENIVAKVNKLEKVLN